MAYLDTQLFLGGEWRDAIDGRSLAVRNPATGQEIGRVAHAGRSDLDLALAAAQRGFEIWRDFMPAQRSKIMRAAAALLRERAGDIASLLTQEQGKPLAEARAKRLPPPTSSNGSRRKASASMAGWSRTGAIPRFGRWSSRIRSARSPPSRRGTSRSIRSSARSAPDSPPDAR